MGWGFGGEKIRVYICMTESLHYSPETITALVIGSTPIQNVFSVKKKKKKKKNKRKIKHKEQSRKLNLCLLILNNEYLGICIFCFNKYNISN